MTAVFWIVVAAVVAVGWLLWEFRNAPERPAEKSWLDEKDRPRDS